MIRRKVTKYNINIKDHFLNGRISGYEKLRLVA